MRKLSKENIEKNKKKANRPLIWGSAVAVALIFLLFTWYGMYTFIKTFGFRSPIILQAPIYRREKLRLKSPQTHKKAPRRAPTPKEEVKAPEIERFAKYLTDQGAINRDWVLNYVSYKGNQLIAFDNLIKSESGFRTDTVNSESGACGLPQSYPCAKMGCGLSVEDLQCQTDWMVKYISSRYGTPLVAWNFKQANNTY